MPKLINDGFTLQGVVKARGQLHDEVLFTYRPALPEDVYTYLRGQSGKTGPELFKLVQNLLTKYIICWNFTDADGSATKPTPQTIARVPQPVVDAMVDHVCGYSYQEREEDEKN